MKTFFAAFLIVCSTSFAKVNEDIVLTDKNHVLLSEDINDSTIATLSLELVYKMAARGIATYPIYIVLDSPGGDIDSGLAFLEFAKRFPRIHTITLFAASMASAIAQGLPGKRYVTETGIFMFHRARGGVGGQFEDGELESRLFFYKGLVKRLEETSAARMSMPIATYKDKVKDELWILGADSVKTKAADAIVNVICTTELTLTAVIKVVNTPMGAFRVKQSGCPLLRYAQLAEQSASKERIQSFAAYKASKLSRANYRPGAR